MRAAALATGSFVCLVRAALAQDEFTVEAGNVDPSRIRIACPGGDGNRAIPGVWDLCETTGASARIGKTLFLSIKKLTGEGIRGVIADVAAAFGR